MNQPVHVILVIYRSTHRTTESHGLWTRLRFGPTKFMGSTVPHLLLGVSVKILIIIFIRCTIMSQFDKLLTAVADGSNGQTDVPYQCDRETLTEQRMRHHVCPSETCYAVISLSTITCRQ